MVAVPDDATNRVLYAQLWAAESTVAEMRAFTEVFRTYGLPMALYSDRAGWAFHTPKAKGPVDKTAPDAGRPRLGPPRRGAHPGLFAASARAQ